MKHSDSIFALILLVVVLVGCDDKREEADTGAEALNQKFFELLQTEGHRVAFDYIFSTNKWLSDSLTEVAKSQFDVLTPQLGRLVGNEFLTKETVGQDLVLYSFLVKYERQPIRVNLSYYHVNDKWQLMYVDYATDLQNELGEAAAVYRLDENLLNLDDGEE